MPTTQQNDWIVRVLDASLGGAGVSAGSGASGGPAAQVWNDAKEAVDQQLNALYGVLKKTGLPVLGEVAGEIESVLGGFRASLVTALMNYDAAAAPKKDAARAAALKVVDDYKARIPEDKHVVAADTNPFGVPITIRATLGAALDQLGKQLAAA